MPNPSTLETDLDQVPESAPVVSVQPSVEKPRQKARPLGVSLETRTVAVSGKLVPMPDHEQTPCSWKRKE